MSFLSVLKTIGEDVDKGIAVAAPIVGEFVPAAGPILNEVATVINDLESKGTQPTAASQSAMVQAIATLSTLKQHAAAATSA